MKDLLDSQPYKLIFAVAMSKTRWLKRIPSEYDHNAVTSYANLKKIIAADGKDILRTMTIVHLDLKRQYSEKKVLSNAANERYEFSIYNLLWARMYVIAYFYYHDDPFWKKAVLGEMLELVPNSTIMRGDVITAVNAINIYFQKEAKLAAYAMMPSEEGVSGSSTQESGRIAELEQQISDKDAEISDLKAQIAELQKQLEELEKKNEHPHLSFIETLDKAPQKIQWAYEDIAKAASGPSEMAGCLHDLQVQGMLKNQERYGKLKNIKKIFTELKNTYHFEWTYPALCRAFTRQKKTK